jgi:acyl carrier protein
MGGKPRSGYSQQSGGALTTSTSHGSAPAGQTPFELELARLIVKAVNLDVPAEQIDLDAPLFNEGLGLDSIDLLEIALVISQEYGCMLRSDDPDNDRIFASMRNLAAHVATHRAK